MSHHVTAYGPEHQSTWDAFVHNAANGTLFHTRAFLSYHPADRFVDASMLIMDGEHIRAVLPAAEISENGKKFLVAHPGASYGGMVFADDVGVKECSEILSCAASVAKEKGMHGIRFLRLPPTSIRRAFSEHQEYWMHQQGWTMTRCEMDGSINLCGVKSDELFSHYTGKCRNMIRQAERAKIDVRVSDDFAGFWTILENTLKRHDAKPTHSLEEILRLVSACPGQVRLFGALEAATLIGGIVVITLHTGALYTLYMAQDYQHQSKHPVHALLSAVLQTAIHEDRSIVHLGVSTEDGGKVINEGLFFFKESFGCRPVRRESWEKIL